MKRAALLAVCLLAVGCKTGHMPDPNDPKEVRLTATTVSKQLLALNENLYTRWRKKEFDEDRYRELLTKGAKEIISDVQMDAMDPTEVWQYAEVLRTAHLWKEAEEALIVAVKAAKISKNEDRRVNDSLRLAHVQARLGKIEEAIATTRSTFDVRPQDAVPVLMGTLYEIIPAARGQKHDVELAKLLEEAIAVNMRAVVDENTDSGRAFVLTRPNHTRKAWRTIIELYEAANRKDLAQEAAVRSMQSQTGFTNTIRT